MRTKKVFQRRVTPSSELFHDPKLLHDIYVVQAHTAWLQELYQLLSLDETSGYEVLGSDTPNTTYVFAQLAEDKIEPIVEPFGDKEGFAIQRLPWYEGEFDYFPDIVELWVNKE